MARSVSVHSNAAAVVYLHLGFEDEFGFDNFLEDVAEVLKSKYPSLSNADRWADREDHVILENGRAEVSVSEYCGLVAVCLAPLDPDDPLDNGWADLVSDGFSRLLAKSYPDAALVKKGVFSNGEAVFEPVNRPGGCVTSKEGVLW